MYSFHQFDLAWIIFLGRYCTLNTFKSKSMMRIRHIKLYESDLVEAELFLDFLILHFESFIKQE